MEKKNNNPVTGKMTSDGKSLYPPHALSRQLCYTVPASCDTHRQVYYKLLVVANLRQSDTSCLQACPLGGSGIEVQTCALERRPNEHTGPTENRIDMAISTSHDAQQGSEGTPVCAICAERPPCSKQRENAGREEVKKCRAVEERWTPATREERRGVSCWRGHAGRAGRCPSKEGIASNHRSDRG